MKKPPPSSYTISYTAKEILVEGHRLRGLSFTAIVEQAILEWGLTHLTPQMQSLYAAMQPTSSGGRRRAT